MPDTNLGLEVTRILDQLNEALTSGDIEAAVNLFQDDCYWRDLVTFTWNIKTMECKDDIRDMLASQLTAIKPSQWQIA
jgi:putative flavoprotein involved in K+ transport